MKTKLKLYIFFLFLLSLVLCGCSIERVISKRNQTKINQIKLGKKDINDEINFFLDQVEAITPNLYKFSNRNRIDSLVKIIKDTRELKSIDFFEKMLTLTGSFNIAHLYLSFPNSYYNKYSGSKDQQFPLKCTLKDSVLVVTKNNSDIIEINIGDEILSINGKKADSLFKNFYKYTGGLQNWKKKVTSNNFHKFLWINNISYPFVVKIKSKKEKIKKYLVSYKKKEKEKFNIDNLDNKNQFKNSFKGKINYKSLYDTIAYIDFNRMDLYRDFKLYDDFLDEVFIDIKNSKTKLLIIDIRNNSGGNSIIGEKIIEYINDTPYRMSGGKKWKVSKEYKENFKKMFPFYLRPFLKTDATIKNYYNSTNKTFIINHKEKIIKKPLENNLRFFGNVYLIISSGTFSSANIFANAIEDFNMATIIGTESGEIVNDYGEIVAVKLKKSGINVWVPSALFIRANGNFRDINPVIPDIHIKEEILNKMSILEITDFIMSLETK